MYMPILFDNDLWNDFFESGRDLRLNSNNSSLQTHRHEKHPMKWLGNSANLLRTDIKEKDNQYELSVAVPGVKKENTKIELNDGYMTISVSSNEEKEEKDNEGHFIRKEIYRGSQERTFYVGEDVKEEDIKAKMENGVLDIIVPKINTEEKKEVKKVINIE